jgi:phosphate transport system permease protein
MSDLSSYTGVRRKKETRWSVRLGDSLSKWIITIGGIGTVLAVSTVFFLLLWVVFPLLLPAGVDAPRSLSTSTDENTILKTAIDEDQLIYWNLLKDSRLRAFRFDDGTLLEERSLFPEKTITASSFALGTSDVILGFDDGTVSLGTIGFQTEFLDQEYADSSIRDLDLGGRAQAGSSMVQRISADQFRVRRLSANFGDPVRGRSSAPILLIDYSTTALGRSYAVYHKDETFNLVRVQERENMLTGEVVVRTESTSLPYEPLEKNQHPGFLTISGLGDSVCLAFADGRLLRYNTRNFETPYLQERVDLVEGDKQRITVLRYLLGKTTLLAGDTTGVVNAWFPARTYTQASGEKSDELVLVLAHTFEGNGVPVTDIASSARMRMIGVGYGDGTVRILHVTSHKELAHLSLDAGETPVREIEFAPKDDGLLARSSAGAVFWKLDPGHPETTFRSLLLPVWYEGAQEPEHVWQSSASTDDFESKFGLMPLIFGTIKATVYSLIFGVPIALLAAVFTSEFLSPRVRVRIKPVVELMASLPSVVLGFLAALVFAPFVANKVPVFLALFLTMPFSFLLGAYLWQILPHRRAIRMQRLRFGFMFLFVPMGVFLALGAGPVLEKLCFGGDIILWLDGQLGGAWGAWSYLLFPLSLILLAWLSGAYISPRIRKASEEWSRSRCAWIDLARFGVFLVSSVFLAALLGFIMSTIGLDPRGGVFGTYVQRNSLVVGFVMGFAIIPIIYTISEDALSAVPEHLRSASLATGATSWQTAVRIIIPTAMSGLFSAVMIGLGRAVGETMIVLMAAGNTPIMEWNIFNGFRTLSANIAVELPEAVVGSTHYRTLFLAALVLFLMTFVLNTLAEVVRLRFRKRASEL